MEFVKVLNHGCASSNVTLVLLYFLLDVESYKRHLLI